MERTRARLESPRYVSTTMSTGRTLKQRWINGFKLAFFASVLFGLVGLPFSVAESAIGWALEGQDWQLMASAWLLYFVAALLIYPILFDWMAAVFRIQFVHKSIRLAPRPSGPPPSATPSA